MYKQYFSVYAVFRMKMRASKESKSETSVKYTHEKYQESEPLLAESTKTKNATEKRLLFKNKSSETVANGSTKAYGSTEPKKDTAFKAGPSGGGGGRGGGGRGGPFAPSVYDKKDKPTPSLFTVIAKVFGKEMLIAWSFKAVYDGMTFINPSLLK